MTDIERLIFLNTMMTMWGLALGDNGWNPKKHEYYVVPEKVLDGYVKERYALLRKLALPETGPKP